VVAARDGAVVAARDGAVVALIPSDEHAARLAVDGGEPAGELHCTLAYLGAAADIDDDTRQAIVDAITTAVADTPQIDADGFALPLFNPGRDEPCTTLGLSGAALADARATVMQAVATVDGFDLPEQHQPWHAHLTLSYTDDTGMAERLVDRAGPLVCDRVRVAFAGIATDIPLAEVEPGPEHARSPRMSDPAARPASSVHLRRLAGRRERTAARMLAHAEREHLTVADLATVRLPWFAVRSIGDPAVGAPETATIFVFDEIGGSFGIDAQELIREIEQITAPAITVRINSPGGAVFDAIAICNALRHHPARVTCYVDALAASAASIIAAAGDDVVMMPGSQMMIHDASAVIDGNPAEMFKMGTWLDRQSDNLADLYRQKAGGDLSTWRALMNVETWMFAAEAVQMGLADRTDRMPDVEPEHEPDPDMDELMHRAHDLAPFGYRYPGRQQAPAPTAPAGQQRTPIGDTTTRLLRRLADTY
jgi:ATP-dependent protease ClpP protease subunit/2'-5' RNA ligase